MDPNIKRIATVAAWLCIGLCVVVPVAIAVGITFGLFDFAAWQVPVIVGCIVGLWRFAAWLAPDPPPKRREDDTDVRDW